MVKDLLWIDDDEPTLERISRLVESPNWNSVVLSDHASGLEDLKRAKYDLVIMDIRMPEGKGQSTLEDSLKKFREHTDAKLIVLSGMAPRPEAPHPYADVLVRKPVDSSRLKDILGEGLIRESRTRQRSTCFISYSHKDEDFAKRLYSDLEENGVSCWYAPEDLKIGEKTRRAIHQAISERDKLLLILSEHSARSEWVADEVEKALELERKEDRLILFPLRLDDAVMGIDADWPASIRNTRHIGSFVNWEDPESYIESLQRLLRDLCE
ncbi:MAG: TIR domain-containing protein [bacterium]|nr:TIR domain-containing protein [bacterium]